MLRIRKVADATTAPNRAAIEAAQKIMREQFSAMPDYDIAKLPDQLSNPLKHRFVSRLFVAENARDQTLGVALLLHAPDIGFSYLEVISTALGRTGRGIGATLYERVREEARALGTRLYFESLPDNPVLSPNPAIREQNAARLKFYERYGARPIVNTAYETPVTPGTSDPPYLMLDPLGSNDLPYGGLDRATVESWFDEMLAAVTPDARVWWINVDYHHDSRWSFNFVKATAVFNETLAERAAADARLEVVDWYSLAEANLQWFFDPVHVDRAGSIGRAQQTVAALPRA